MVRVSPADVTLLPGESQTVEICVDDVEDLWAFALEISFDPASLTVSGLEPGEFLSTEPGRYLFNVNEKDKDRGLISLYMTQVRKTDTDPLPRDGSGVLIRFQVLAKPKPGESNLTVKDLLLSNRDGVSIPVAVANGTVHIAGEGFFVYLPLISH